MSTTKQFDLNLHTARLLMQEPFFAALSRRINKVSTNSLPTAGVTINPTTKQFELLYNPEFMGKLSEIEKLGVLKHEFYHLIFEHVTDRSPSNPNLATLWNYACDLAINSYLENELPEQCCIPGKNVFKNLKKYASAEAYFESLKKQIKQNQQNGNKGSGKGDDPFGGGQFDNHNYWGVSPNSSDNDKDGDGSIVDVAKERLKDILKKSVQESQQSGGWGTISAECQKEILERIQTRIDWRKMLRYFIRTSQRADKSSTVRKINKRYQYIHPGKKVNRVAEIAIAIDQSGSISDNLLSLFFSELNKLAEIATFTVIPHDHEIAENGIFKWKKNQKVKTKRVLLGGTSFNPPTDYINKRKFDGAIFLTDLEAPKPKACKCQRIWMTDKEHGERPYFKTHERIVIIDK